MEFRKYCKINENEKNFEKEEISNFLFTNLEKYGDKLESIKMAMDYAVADEKGKGGFVLVGYEDKDIVGAVVINKTGMGGYIPENILVYIAVHSDARGKGYGRKLMEKAIDEAEGDIALHVEANNPAKKLYEKLGFTNPYLEMRLKK
jgi:GNAT superfamily N-acetyltransferase